MSGIKGKSGVYKRTAFHKEINSNSQKGKVLLQATKQKISDTNKRIGKRPPVQWGRVKSSKELAIISAAHKGKKISKEVREKISKSLTGYKHTKETKKKMADNHKGEKCIFWRGGITPVSMQIRMSPEYKLWRISVFARDNYTCQICKEVGGILNAHHIKSFSQYPELRFEKLNGITMCRECHKRTDNYLKYNTKNAPTDMASEEIGAK